MGRGRQYRRRSGPSATARVAASLTHVEAMLYTLPTVYVHKAMRSGFVVRISLPRALQRHMRVRPGDLIAMEEIEGGKVRMWKLREEDLRRGEVRPSGSETP